MTERRRRLIEVAFPLEIMAPLGLAMAGPSAAGSCRRSFRPRSRGTVNYRCEFKV